MTAKKSKKSGENSPSPANVATKDLIVVGIGASAGGLEAFESFFTHMPAESGSGIAFVLVQHLDPTHKSILTDLVKHYTKMKVFEVEDGVAVQPNCTYIIPPNKDMALLHGKLHLIEPELARGMRLPIDFFFRSLAQDQHERAICIVLSGTGTDGTLGLKAIKGEGGMAMVQDPKSAKYDGMPRSAIATDLMDYILSPDKMPAQLLTYAEHAFGKAIAKEAPPPPKVIDSLQKIFILLRAQTGHDFSYYKQNTIHRRIERRMAVNQIEQIDLYVRYLQQNPLEVETLFRELLIGVTNFFRDPEAFAILEEQIIPQLFESKSPGETIRVWGPGCSTGEEVYSLAILLRERMNALKQEYKVQVFATDIDNEAIEKARAGVYPDSIATDVSAERLHHFFSREDNHYRIKKTIRDMVVFAQQNVIEDPPFSRLDLISCRNLLIYLGLELQKRVISLFHYALNQDGFLFLGNSETIGEFSDFFGSVDRKWKLYQRKKVISPQLAAVDFPTSQHLREGGMMIPSIKAKGREERVNLREVVEQALLTEYTPACVIVNEKGEVLYIHGHTGKYLEPASGEATLNVIRMARKGLNLELAVALRKVVAQKEMIRYEGLRVKTNGNTHTVNLIVAPVTKPALMPDLVMILFEDVADIEPSEAPALELVGSDKDQHIADMERELRAKEEHLQTIIEELETSNEELKSTNEELQSTNEELQSTNEELETSKEELQSVNEELLTVNTELQKKVDELSRANNDMNNLIAGTGIATIFVDHQLRIQRFTPPATQVINLIQTDVGRPVNHIVSNLAYGNLVKDIKAVLNSLIPKEVEVRTEEGVWYLMRILPYRTRENVIDGAVLTFVQITQQKQTQAELHQLNQQVQAARDYAENIVETIREPLLVLDDALKVISANPAFYKTFKVSALEVIGKQIYQLGNNQWDIPTLRKVLEEILPEQNTLNDYEVTHDFEVIGKRTMRLNAREINRAAGKEERLILLALEDITDK
jgi:two-component system CheB/CheR fusion protein